MMESQENNEIYLVCLFQKFAEQWDLSTMHLCLGKTKKEGEEKSGRLNTQMTKKL